MSGARSAGAAIIRRGAETARFGALLLGAACLCLLSAAQAQVGGPSAAPAQGQAQADADALAWLQRIQAAGQKLSFSGTFVYQHGDQLETSMITRLVDAAGRQERLETLSGPPREIIRLRDQVTCYLPEQKTVRIDRQVADRSFPAILPPQLAELAEVYQIRRGEAERVAGFDTQIIILTPRDRMRYGHRLWAEVNTGLPVRARTIDERGHVIETFEFTQLQIGNVDAARLKSRYAARGRDWKVEDSAARDANLQEAGWQLRGGIPGFRKIGELRRNLSGTAEVGHLLFSDGLAAVSLFIEPWSARPDPVTGLARQGAMNVYSRRLGDYRITVVGETPPENVRYFANAITYKKAN